MQEPWRRRHLWSLTHLLGSSLGVPAQSPIVPLVIGGEDATMAASTQLLARGLHVPAIRPPTVPPGTSRLRVSLSAAHSSADIEELVAALRECGVQFQQFGSAAGTAAAGEAVERGRLAAGRPGSEAMRQDTPGRGATSDSVGAASLGRVGLKSRL
jgi:8-amino-7-oxononanoate synthase